MKAVVEGKLFRVLFGNLSAALALFRPQELSHEKRPITLLQRVQFWKSLRHRKHLRIARVNPGHQGINGVIQKFPPEAPLHKLADGLLHALGRAADELAGIEQAAEIEPGEGRIGGA